MQFCLLVKNLGRAVSQKINLTIAHFNILSLVVAVAVAMEHKNISKHQKITRRRPRYNFASHCLIWVEFCIFAFDMYESYFVNHSTNKIPILTIIWTRITNCYSNSPKGTLYLFFYRAKIPPKYLISITYVRFRIICRLEKLVK